MSRDQDSTITSIELSGKWKENQEEMGVSAAEWCRRMIRLGCRQYGLPYDPDEMPEINGIKTEKDEKADTDHFRQFLISNLSTDRYLEIEEILDIAGDEIEETLESLESAGVVDSSYRQGFKLESDWRERDDG